MIVKPRAVFLVVSLVVVVGLAGFASGAASLAGKGGFRLVGLFGQALALIRANYVEEVSVDKLELGAMTGLVEAADPGGMWVPKEATAAWNAARTRTSPAFGLVLGKRSSYPFVLQVLPGSAAEKAGILPGELIERIGDEPVRARPLWRSQVLLDEGERQRGEVTVDVIDRQLDGERRLTLRALPPSAIEVAVNDHAGIPVLRVPVLDELAVSRVEAALASLTADNLVVDVRGLAVGDAKSAVRIAAMIAGGAVEVKRERREDAGDVLKAGGPVRAWRVLVCVDAATAGPGEVLALGLKSRGATLVGGESFGDTGERKVIHASGGDLWLADRWCVRPDGKPLLGNGLKPDEPVRYRKDADAVLDRALELARGSAAKQAA